MPSNAVLEAKKAKVEQLTEVIKGSVSGVLVDYKNEISIKSDNYSCYDFSIIEEDKLKSDILDSIFDHHCSMKTSLSSLYQKKN